MSRNLIARALAALAVFSACGNPVGSTAGRTPIPGDTVATVPTTPAAPQKDTVVAVGAVEIASHLASPTFVGSPAGDSRIFVAERLGRVRVIENGELRPAPFLDISARVSDGGERGLLSLAFHPRFRENGRFFVYYTDRDGNVTVERYTAGPDSASAASAALVLRVPMPYANHTGGGLAFVKGARTPAYCRPALPCPAILATNLLLIGLGDGGSAGDPQGHGQNPATLLGSILRLDVDAQTAPYGIPAGNPYTVTGGGRPEVWATGVQDVAGLAVDPVAGILYTADASSTVQEVNVAPLDAAGINYGWNAMLGSRCVITGCNPSGFSAPALEYERLGETQACGIVGATVYQGTKIPALTGHYLFGDRCIEGLASFRFANLGAPGMLLWGTHTAQRIHSAPLVSRFVSAVGLDGEGEPVVATEDGRVFRILAGAR